MTCKPNSKKLCDNDCDICFQKSFASHPRAKDWNYDKNGDITPRQVFKGTPVEYSLNCAVCNHAFDMALKSINAKRWDPYCGHQRLCSDEKCAFCLKSSFASHPRAIYWSDDNDKTARQVFKNNKNKYTLIVTYARILLKCLQAILMDKIAGVRFVIINNYVMMKNVLCVLTILSQVTQKQNT